MPNVSPDPHGPGFLLSGGKQMRDLAWFALAAIIVVVALIVLHNHAII